MICQQIFTDVCIFWSKLDDFQIATSRQEIKLKHNIDPSLESTEIDLHIHNNILCHQIKLFAGITIF